MTTYDPIAFRDALQLVTLAVNNETTELQAAIPAAANSPAVASIISALVMLNRQTIYGMARLDSPADAPHLLDEAEVKDDAVEVLQTIALAITRELG